MWHNGRVIRDAHNPHAGAPFSDDDAVIAEQLEAVSTPALLCSLVHMTGDPSWIRGDLRPQVSTPMDVQSGMTHEMRAEVRRSALPALAAYRDDGCTPAPLPAGLAREMMEFLACRPVDDAAGVMFEEDLQLDGADPRAITWGDEITPAVKADAHVVVIGCGESGIVAGIRLAQAGLPFTIVDKGAGPGGTWRDNRYPGARVDVGSHHYCYSFEPADHWSEYYCRQPELEAYFTRVLDTYDLRPHCRFDTEVTAATWDDATGRWQVELRTPDGTTEVFDARFLISSVGSLNLPRYPNLPGMDDFAGPSFHSARWPDGLDITGARFALVGAGASGFQIAPTIADDVGQLTIFQRTAQWMFPNPIYHESVPDGDRWAMRHLPFYGRWFRFLMMWPGVGAGVEPYRQDPAYSPTDGRAINDTSAGMREWLTGWITSHLDGRHDLVEKSLPAYPPAGKRIMQDNGSWLKCLVKPNVELVRTAIERIVPEGVVTADGTVHEADIICYATGFRHSEYLMPIRFTGRNGVDLHEQWGDEPTAYLGITIPRFPNLFCVYGPGTNLAHGVSLIYHSECQVNYAMSAIHAVLRSGAQAIEVRKDVHDDYAERYQREISQLVWAHATIEHSHYKNRDGKVFTLSPWPIPDYWRWTHAVDTDDYILG
jgi:4-hydroxyacetophenone monooxygenase